MQAREAILEYLETHDTFRSDQVAEHYGITQGTVTRAVWHLSREKMIVLVHKVWRTNTYRLATDEGGNGDIQVNTIFSDCRNSAAMKRVLSVYGIMT